MTAVAQSAQNKERIVKLLLDRPDVDVNAHDFPGTTALAMAVAKGYYYVLSVLLRRNDIDINTTDVQGRTPLILAALFERVNLVQILLDHKEIKTDVQDMFGATALSYITQRLRFNGGEKDKKRDIFNQLRQKRKRKLKIELDSSSEHSTKRRA